MKYQPYHGYWKKPWHCYGWPGYGHRIKTRSDWRWESRPPTHHGYSAYHIYRAEVTLCKHCNKVHCSWCNCYKPWKKWDKSSAATYHKQLAHRTFRRRAKNLIRRELHGEEPSHTIRYCGDWLD